MGKKKSLWLRWSGGDAPSKWSLRQALVGLEVSLVNCTVGALERWRSSSVCPWETQLRCLSPLVLYLLCHVSVIQIPVQLGVLVAYTVLIHVNKNHICGGLQLEAIQIAVQSGCGINKSWVWEKKKGAWLHFRGALCCNQSNCSLTSSFWPSLYSFTLLWKATVAFRLYYMASP